MEKERIQFQKGKQKEFIAEAKKLSGKSWKKAGWYFQINNNTFQTYWKERTRISKKDFEKICFELQIKSASILEKYLAKELLWDYSKQIINAGYRNLWKEKTKTIASNILFISDIKELDNSQVTFSKTDTKKQIILPKEITPLLAEEIGTSIGDGFISNNKYEYRLKGNINDEKEYYVNFVKPMFKELFNVNLNVKEYESTIGFELYSQAIWEFKTKVIGLPMAPKTDIRVPKKLKINNADVLCALLRGLFDTDGCIYFRSQGRNKSYYPVISFFTVSKNLGNDVLEILKMLGFSPNIYLDLKITERNPSPKYTVVLYGYANFELYKKLINTRQPKNITKLKAWEEKFGNNG